MKHLMSDPSFQRRWQALPFLAALVLVGWVGLTTSVGCSPTDDGEVGLEAEQASPVVPPPADEEQLEVAVDETSSSLAGLIEELPPAPIGLDALSAEEAIAPVTLTIPDLGIQRSVIVDVGVEADGAMEVPPVDEIGWYRYGATPTDSGATVLAAHVAFDGVDGVFVNLDQLQPSSEIEVTSQDGTITRYIVRTNSQYAKEGLPDDELFGRDGDPRLVLITCGGRFDPERRSYDDNIVVVADRVT